MLFNGDRMVANMELVAEVAEGEINPRSGCRLIGPRS
jgi:hypothetical protein